MLRKRKEKQKLLLVLIMLGTFSRGMEEKEAPSKGNGKSFNEEASRLLMKEVKGKNVNGVQQALRGGADPNFSDETTPLHEAAFAGETEIMRLLIAAGANLNAQNERQRTPLGEAAWRNQPEAVGMLIAAGADVNAHAENGFAPLHDASRLRSSEIAKKLVDAGAKLDARITGAGLPMSWFANLEERALGWTPLHFAAANGCYEVVKFLLKADANPKVRDDQRRTPQDLVQPALRAARLGILGIPLGIRKEHNLEQTIKVFSGQEPIPFVEDQNNSAVQDNSSTDRPAQPQIPVSRLSVLFTWLFGAGNSSK